MASTHLGEAAITLYSAPQLPSNGSSTFLVVPWTFPFPGSQTLIRVLPQVLARRLRLEGDFDFKLVAQRTPGFVGADLEALTKEAAAIAVTRIFRELREAGAAGEEPELDRMQGGPLTPEELKCVLRLRALAGGRGI